MTKIKKVQKLDRRHTGHQVFKYYVEPAGHYIDSIDTLNIWREWAWATWGPGAERDVAARLAVTERREYQWAWDTEHGNCRIYLKTDAELSWFSLRWS